MCTCSTALARFISIQDNISKAPGVSAMVQTEKGAEVKKPTHSMVLNEVKKPTYAKQSLAKVGVDQVVPDNKGASK